MRRVSVYDSTLCQKGKSYSFKEKLEIVRQLDKLLLDVIELPEIVNVTEDSLFTKTISSYVKERVISISGGNTKEGIDKAYDALKTTAKPRIRVEIPMSPVNMEFVLHKKGDKAIEYIKELVTYSVGKGMEVEFAALDATRAEKESLYNSIKVAIESGAKYVSIYDDAQEMLPDDFSLFVEEIVNEFPVPIICFCNNKNEMALAEGLLSIKKGASGIKTVIGKGGISLEAFSNIIRDKGETFDIHANLKITEVNRTVKQISWAIDENRETKTISVVESQEESFELKQESDIEDIKRATSRLGYDLTEDDLIKVYESFQRVAAKKVVSSRDLDAIIASSALQVPSTYKLVSYIINNGNLISASAAIKLEKEGKVLSGIRLGDGPIDAAFIAIEEIIGHHYELDDFQIQAVTEGKEAVGQAIVRLRSNGKLYSGSGISTDIIGASIRAYINALNKIVYEEE